jgi:delta(3,5)-delta(2,4)-dienoyl-CoA isomerase
MWINLGKIFNRLSVDPDVRAILFSGAGPKAFTAGLDVQAASQGSTLGGGKATQDGARTAAHIRAHAMEFQECVSSLEKCAKPVIALLHGYSYGLGIDMSVAADIRICTQDAKMCVKEVDIGIAADVGTLTRLPKIGCSLSWVKDVCLTAREFYAEEAQRVGFVSSVFANKEEGIKGGLALASQIAKKSPVAIFGTKELINWSRDKSVEDGEFLLTA